MSKKSKSDKTFIDSIVLISFLMGEGGVTMVLDKKLKMFRANNWFCVDFYSTSTTCTLQFLILHLQSSFRLPERSADLCLSTLIALPPLKISPPSDANNNDSNINQNYRKMNHVEDLFEKRSISFFLFLANSLIHNKYMQTWHGPWLWPSNQTTTKNIITTTRAWKQNDMSCKLFSLKAICQLI